MDKSLCKKTPEKALHDTMLQMKVHRRLIKRGLRLENHGTDWRSAAPAVVTVTVLGRRAKRVKRVGPVGGSALRRFERREFEGGGSICKLGLL